MRNSKFARTVRTPSGGIGFAILVFLVLVAVIGPFVAPHSTTAPVGPAANPPGSDYLLGTDYLGRDVLSRLLHGGTSVILMGLSATIIAYLLGLTIGIAAGYSGRITDMLSMRGMDIILAFPPLIVLLLLVGGLESHIWVLVLGVIIVQLPSIARISRAATLSVAKTNYVEAAKARGDSFPTIARRDVLPNILPTVAADFGIRFGLSIILIASMNYLGLGLQPPAADWGLMISENQAYIALNPWAVISPAIMLALITIGVNLFADAYIRVAFTGIRSVAGALPEQAEPTPSDSLAETTETGVVTT